MTILREIQSWAAKQPAWQQHAVALLYENSQLSAGDLEDILALLKASKDIPDPKKRAARQLTEEQVAAPQTGEVVVKLTAIQNLKNVNALASGKSLPVAPDGLTVIYGDNGVGKSGYSRVLKQACRARDRSEKIRPNAYVNPILTDPASAELLVMVGDEVSPRYWTDGKASPPELSSIAIFDARCARAYVDNQGDFSYVPYGLDILEGLAKACGSLKDMVAREQAAAKPNLDAFAKLAQSPSEAGLLVRGLSAKTRKDDVERLASLTDEELTEFDTLTKTLCEADPTKRATELRVKASRLDGLIARIDAAAAVVDHGKLVALRELIEKSTKAKATAQAVARRFEAMDTLEGTGSDPWLEMFRLAREFCALSPTVKEFPRLGADAKCPMCQNELGDEGSQRLFAFDEFIEAEATRAAKTAYTAATTAFRAIVDAAVDLAFDETLVHDLEASPELIQACNVLQQSLKERRDATRAAATPNSEKSWDDIPALSANPRERLALLAATWREAAKKLDESQDAAAKVKMEKRHVELGARRQLLDLKAAALAAIDQLVLAARLVECIAATATTNISRKSTELTSTMASEEVAAVLAGELLQLGVNTIKVAMRPSSAKAKTTFKLVLETQSGDSPQDILSEGEQRAIAIASFLAEVRLSKGKGGIVFDDPVSSLDHGRRERVARRIAAEALERQVVVFTHDLFFLNVLMHEASALGREPKALTLTQTLEGFGVAEESLPFEGASVSKRVGMLRNRQVDCARMRKAGDEAAYRLNARALYSDLRTTWERGVEEVLLNQTVLRFRKGIETQRLREVAIDPEDLAAINAGMSNCSNYTGHDGALIANVAPPSPEEMEADINALEAWRKSAVQRREKRRA